MTLSETQTSRVLKWEGCFNVRDLGGLTTDDGGRTRTGALVRADVPTRLTSAGRAALLDHGIRTMVDLRFATEVARDWDAYPFQDLVGDPEAVSVAYANVPFNTGRDPADDDYARTAVNLEPLIVEWLDSISDDANERDRLRALAMPAREAMLDALAHLRRHYDSAETYLRDGGLSGAQVERLRARLVGEA